MTDTVAPSPAPARRTPLAIMIGVALATFVIGAVMAWLAMQWWRPPVAPQTQPGESAAEPLRVAAPAPAAPPPVASDPASLAAREEMLAAQLAALEQRTALVSGQAASAAGNANRAEALMVAFAARRAIDRGLGLGYLEQQLRDRFGAVRPTEVNLVIRAARQPVTAEDLRLGIDTIGPQLAFGGDGNWLEALRRQLASLIVIHRQGDPSPAPAERLDRIRRLLGQRQVEAAIAEVARLPGGEQATRWMAAAQQFVAAHDALDTLEQTALQGSATPTPPNTPR
jgi:hypothetical protein